MARNRRLVTLHTHDNPAICLQWAGRRIRVASSHSARIRNDVACVASTFVCEHVIQAWRINSANRMYRGYIWHFLKIYIFNFVQSITKNNYRIAWKVLKCLPNKTPKEQILNLNNLGNGEKQEASEGTSTLTKAHTSRMMIVSVYVTTFFLLIKNNNFKYNGDIDGHRSCIRWLNMRCMVMVVGSLDLWLQFFVIFCAVFVGNSIIT